MRIEEEVFARHRIVPEKLIAYGFTDENGRLTYARALPDDGMKIIVEYDGTIKGRIIDLSLNDEYTAFRVEGATGYSAQIRQKYIELLTDIRDHCGKNQYFKMPQAQRIGDHILEAYGSAPEFLWPNIPSYAAFRQPGKKKWFAVMGSVPLNKVDRESKSAQPVEVINVKVDQERIKDYLSQMGIYEAFHMNKKCWVSIILDDTLPDDAIQGMIDDSARSIQG